MTSSLVTRPRSPWAASPGCRKQAGVPVDDRVVATFRATMPTLPMPVVMTLPLQRCKMSTAWTKSALSGMARMASASALENRPGAAEFGERD